MRIYATALFSKINGDESGSVSEVPIGIEQTDYYATARIIAEVYGWTSYQVTVTVH